MVLNSRSVPVSVATYTYNDHDLVFELIESIRQWSVIPKEIIVVDDGSKERFRYKEKEILFSVKTILLEKNCGPTTAKSTGLDSTTQKFIMSIDSDTRVEKDWLKKTLPLLFAKNIGMMSSILLYKMDDTLLGKYMHLTYSYRYYEKTISMIPGPVFLIRKDIYNRIGGFQGYSNRKGEDEFLCKKIIAHGLRLEINRGVVAYQVRKLTRHTAIKRGWIWQSNTFQNALESGNTFEDVVKVLCFSVSRKPAMQDNVNNCLKYYDFLYCCHAVLSMLADVEGGKQKFYGFLYDLLDDYTQVKDLLFKDLVILGHAKDSVLSNNDSSFDPIARIFPRELLKYFEEFCVHDIKMENADEDFSMYK